MGYVGERLTPLFDPALATAATQRMADRGADAMMEYAREATPVNYNPFTAAAGESGLSRFGVVGGREPGTLKRRWRRVAGVVGTVRRTIARGQPAWRGEFENWDPIAAFVENDTRPHIIRPRTPGGRLRFRLWPTGEVVTASMVKHPGTTGHHMTLKAANRVQVEFGRLMRPEAERWAKTVVRQGRRQNRR